MRLKLSKSQRLFQALRKKQRRLFWTLRQTTWILISPSLIMLPRKLRNFKMKECAVNSIQNTIYKFLLSSYNKLKMSDKKLRSLLTYSIHCSIQPRLQPKAIWTETCGWLLMNMYNPFFSYSILSKWKTLYKTIWTETCKQLSKTHKKMVKKVLKKTKTKSQVQLR